MKIVRVGWRSQTVGRVPLMIPRVLLVRYHITGQRRTDSGLTAYHPSLQILPMLDRDTQWEPTPRATTHIVACELMGEHKIKPLLILIPIRLSSGGYIQE